MQKKVNCGVNAGITAIRLFFLVVVSVLIASVLMILLYSIPTGIAFENAQGSLEMYGEERIDNWSGGAIYSRLSNNTDSLMIMHALYHPYDSRIENAFLTPRPNYGLSEPENLVQYLHREEPLFVSDYSYYWHGYLLYMIPALQLFNVGEIKVLMMYVQFILSMLVIYELGKRSKIYMWLYSVVALFINPVTTVMTFQNADIYCIMMIFMIIILKYNDWFKENNRYLYLFTLNGIVVAFADYLTYPLVAYGVPLITVLLINDHKFRESIKVVIYNSLAWVWGYAGMWAGKWIVTDLLTGTNTILTALKKIVSRTGGDVSALGYSSNSYVHALSNLFECIADPPMFVLGLIAAVMICICLYQKRDRYKNMTAFLRASTGILMVGIVPFIWFFVLRNHTIIHPHLAYRQLAVTIWALLAISAKPFVQMDRPDNMQADAVFSQDKSIFVE